MNRSLIITGTIIFILLGIDSKLSAAEPILLSPVPRSVVISPISATPKVNSVEISLLSKNGVVHISITDKDNQTVFLGDVDTNTNNQIVVNYSSIDNFSPESNYTVEAIYLSSNSYTTAFTSK